MTQIFILTVVLILMTAAPLILAELYYCNNKGTVLHINQDRVRDERYFAKSFAAKVESRLSSLKDGQILLSRPEQYVDADTAAELPDPVEHIVLSQNRDFHSPGNVKEYKKEIYCAKNAVLDTDGTVLRAVCCRGKMRFGKGITVVRWADAEETFAVYEDCDLGISATAGVSLSIAGRCTFRRIYAPVVYIGQRPSELKDPVEGRDPRIFRMPIQPGRKNRRYISSEMINSEGVADFSVASWTNVTVTEGVIVQGDVRSHRGIRLCEGAVVCGNLFAEKDIILEKGAVVLGNVFSQGSVRLEAGTMVGKPGSIVSLVARNHIVFTDYAFLFGYASCELGGKVAPDAGDAEKAREDAGEECFLKAPEKQQNIRFRDLFDYEHVDRRGYRKQADILTAEIPDGAQKIQESMFFRCTSLQKVRIPDSMVSIGKYAFADDSALSEIGDLSATGMEEIGESAFENCSGLKEVRFPRSLRILHSAAFAGDKNLARITFPEDSVLIRMEDHCFRDCSSLQEVTVPDRTEYIGISAFRGCSSLKKLSLPAGIGEQPGLIQLIKEHPEICLKYREIAVKPGKPEVAGSAEKDGI